MPTVRLTDITIRNLKPPTKGQVTYWDIAAKGFNVRASQGGTLTYSVVYGVNRQRVTIGRVGVISLKDAREQAKRILAERTLGKTRPLTITFEEAQNRFLEASKHKNRLGTYQEYKRLLDRHFRLSSVPLADITTEEVMRRIHKLRDTPSEQNHAFVAARAFFRWCVRHRLLDRSPIDGLSLPAPTRPRERVLTDDELGAVYQHALAYPYPYGAIVSLLILTGQRRGEIAALRWDWIDGDTITLPSTVTKNRRSHTFPLGETASAVIAGIPQIGDHLFPATRSHIRGKPTTIFAGWSKSKPRFDKGLDVEPYTLHDIRRTFASTLARLGTPIHVTEKLLNHATGTISGVAAIYNRHTYLNEMREAVQRYEAHLQSLRPVG